MLRREASGKKPKPTQCRWTTSGFSAFILDTVGPKNHPVLHVPRIRERYGISGRKSIALLAAWFKELTHPGVEVSTSGSEDNFF
jgi:hypothetical protein